MNKKISLVPVTLLTATFQNGDESRYKSPSTLLTPIYVVIYENSIWEIIK